MDERAVILAELSKAGLSQLSDVVAGMIKSAIAVTAVADAAIDSGSRFGGDPDLPSGAEWPRAWDLPMEFLAQVRLADVAAHDVDGVLPTTGSLLFFYNSQFATSFDETENPFECGRVLYVPDGVALVRTPAPCVDFEDEFGRRIVPTVHSPVSITFRRTVSLPSQGAFLRRDGHAALLPVWDDFLDRVTSVTHKGASTRNQMLGHMVQHDDLDAMSTEDVLLFQIDSDPAPGFEWGKRHFLYFVAPAADVSNRDFSRVRVNHGVAC